MYTADELARYLQPEERRKMSSNESTTRDKIPLGKYSDKENEEYERQKREREREREREKKERKILKTGCDVFLGEPDLRPC